MPQTPPDALLFVTPGCPYCPAVLQGLGDLVKEGVIGRLEVINAAARPDLAAQHGVRTAPWTRIGPFQLEGARAASELRRWAEAVNSPEGVADYVAENLRDGGLASVEALFSHRPDLLPHLLPLLGNPGLEIQIRLGIGAILEGLAGSDALQQLVPQLGHLSADSDHRIRSDACHYLGLSGSPEAAAFLRPRLDDEQAEVREIATDALEALGIKR